MKAIRRNIFNTISSDKAVVKALALAVFIKRRFQSSTIHNYTVNKLHELTGLHATTIRKRIGTLDELGFITRAGKNREHLVVTSMSSHNSRRNVDISSILCDNIQEIEKSLFAMAIVEIQKRKNFVKQVINLAYCTPNNLAECKNARRKCRELGYGREYKEYGISYKRIAKKLGICLQKAINIVKFAIENEFLTVTKRCTQKFVPGVKSMQDCIELGKNTFCTNNNVYTVYANQYALGTRVLAGNY